MLQMRCQDAKDNRHQSKVWACPPGARSMANVAPSQRDSLKQGRSGTL